MNDQPELPPVTPPTPLVKPERKRVPGILWLLEAFIPSVVALGIMEKANASPYLGVALSILCVVCSVIAAVGLVRGMRSLAMQIILGIFLAGFFFIMNVVVVVFIGCSRSGPM